MRVFLPIVLLVCVSQPASAGAFGHKPEASWPQAMAAPDVERRTAANLRLRLPKLIGQRPDLAGWAKRYRRKLDSFCRAADKAQTSLEIDAVRLPPSIRKEGLALRRRWIRAASAPAGAAVLSTAPMGEYVEAFNAADSETIVNFVPNALAFDWMKVNVPLFECPQEQLERIYYYRWWTFRKHLKLTADGFVLTEFLAPVGHAGRHNTISCAVGHHITEGRWLRDGGYMDDYTTFWYRAGDNGRVKHLHRYSNWLPYAAWQRYLVNGDRAFVVDLLDDFVADVEAWEKLRGTADGMFWQYDVLDGGEESISGSRTLKNVRPPLNCYIYGSLLAISRIAELADDGELAAEYDRRAAELQKRINERLWNERAEFFVARLENGALFDGREAIGFIPWYFNIPEPGREKAWLQILDEQGFKAPKGLTTAERRHPDFRSHGVGTCEWDGAVWPFASTQTLTALANVLRNYEQDYVTKRDYFEALLVYARSHQRNGRPYVGEYLDEVTGRWLTPDSDRSRFYNHSAFCDLVISQLAGVVPRAGGIVEIDPLLPEDAWPWFCLDNVLYHGRNLTVIWDKSGEKYGRGAGLTVLVDDKPAARRTDLGKLRVELPRAGGFRKKISE